jgi:peroxiredoxin family protein
MPPADQGARPAKLSLVVFSGEFAKVHYALATAAAAAAIDIPATLFFTMKASRALAKDDGWHALAGDAAASDATLQARDVAGFAELLESCQALGVRFLVCTMGLSAIDLAADALRDDLGIELGGLVSFLNDARADGSVVFV